jgi:secreted PhoX family phosphatase
MRATNRHRRLFLKRSAACVGGLVTAVTLETLSAHARPSAAAMRKADGYGAVTPIEDQNGDAILALPHGFNYVTFSKIGAPMTDDNITPINLDGMAAFPGTDGAVRLIRNHEVKNPPGDREGAVEGPARTRYDHLGVGGAVTIDFDPRCLAHPRRYPPVLRDFVSLNGTIVNCSGGYAFRDAGWFSCEESTEGAREGWRQKHGYVFLVPASVDVTMPATPILGMGRFRHEAAVADPTSGIVYLTEDQPGSGSGFYRFLPKDPVNLVAGGRLEMLKIAGKPRADLRVHQCAPEPLPVEWVVINDPDPDLEHGASCVFDQGFDQDGAKFNRLEGLFRGEDGSVYCSSTSGGNFKTGDVADDNFADGYGQIWRYVPGGAQGKLELVFESPGSSVLDSPDNLTITPKGGLLICEDHACPHDGDTHPLAPGISKVNRLIGLTRDGKSFEFAINRLNNTEFSGVCFSPSGDMLFVNIYGNGQSDSGMTCAITGPWAMGPL